MRNCTALHRLGMRSDVNTTVLESFQEITAVRYATAVKCRAAYVYSTDVFIHVPDLPNPGASVDY